MAKTVVLMDGTNGEIWCELRPIEGGDGSIDRAVIVGHGLYPSTFGEPGDVVGKPAELSWEEAAELLTPGRTVLSPMDLYFIEGLAGVEGEGEILFDEIPDPRGDWNAALNYAAESEAYKRALDAAFAERSALPVPFNKKRRRRSDQVA